MGLEWFRAGGGASPLVEPAAGAVSPPNQDDEPPELLRSSFHTFCLESKPLTAGNQTFNVNICLSRINEDKRQC